MEYFRILVITVASLPTNQHRTLFPPLPPPPPPTDNSITCVMTRFIFFFFQFSAILLFITPGHASLTRGSRCDKI